MKKNQKFLELDELKALVPEMEISVDDGRTIMLNLLDHDEFSDKSLTRLLNWVSSVRLAHGLIELMMQGKLIAAVRDDSVCYRINENTQKSTLSLVPKSDVS